MRVLVCGGRNFTDKDFVFRSLDQIHSTTPITCIIHGGAKGADHLGYLWASERAVGSEEFVAHWKSDGRAAGPLRNQRMLDDGKPNLVLAFAGGRGTADMMRRTRLANIHLIETAP